MDHTAQKRSVLKAARSRLEATASELSDRISELRSVTLGDDNAESASQTESTRGSDVELMNSLGEQLELVQREKERLEQLLPEELIDTVGYGAVVHTDLRNFLIATSLEEFDAGGRSYLGVSTKAPLIQSLLGKRAGDKATFNGITYHIQEVF